MYRPGLLVGVLCALVVANPPTLAAGGEPSPHAMIPGPSSKLALTCYFGEPSESCVFTCNQQSMDAYCDDEKKQCLCKPSDKEPETNLSQSESDEDPDEETPLKQTPQTDSTTALPKTNFKLSDFCTLGYPSPSCILHCREEGLKSYCDEEQGLCLCRPPPADQGIINMDWLGLWQAIQRGGSNPPQDPASEGGSFNTNFLNLLGQIKEEGVVPGSQDSQEVVDPSNEDEDDAHHLVFYVFDLSTLLGDNNTESSNSSFRSPVLHTFSKSIEGWEVSHVLAVILIIFLCGVVCLEIAFCIKKEKPKPTDMESIFPSKQ